MEKNKSKKIQHIHFEMNNSGVAFPKLRPWAETNFGLDTSYTLPAQKNLPPVPKFISNPEFLNDIKDQYAKISTEGLFLFVYICSCSCLCSCLFMLFMVCLCLFS